MKLFTTLLVLSILGAILAVPMDEITSTGAYQGNNPRHRTLNAGQRQEASTSSWPQSSSDEPYDLEAQMPPLTEEKRRHLTEMANYCRDQQQYDSRRQVFQELKRRPLRFDIEHFLNGWALARAPNDPVREMCKSFCEVLMKNFGPGVLDWIDQWLYPEPKEPRGLGSRSSDGMVEQYRDMAEGGSNSLRQRRQRSEYGPRQ